jgi:WD40 repeat protein/tRNA A-37 threonylcarbamoyl transferase component Bud32
MSSSVSDSDFNLLFGVLALQTGLLGNDQFAEACAAWTTCKHRLLADLLVERAWLTAEECQEVERLVQRHLLRHGGDAHKSLAAVAAALEAPATLHDIADADLQASLVLITRSLDTDRDRTVTYSPRPVDVGGSRYRVLRPHARGGLGEVFVAEDQELHREVALKEVRSEHADDPDTRARFLREGEMAGRLEHPGLVPVYGLGTYADGRPFYAMRLIQGQSLRDAIQAFYAADETRPDSGERSLVLRQLLGRFVALCNTVAYLHSRGVLHRDLKPANVMLGKYGETLLVDLGLAKVVGRADREAAGGAEETLRPSSDDSLVTRAGTVVGTPAYMSPEQAAGRTEQLGPTSDVYSLGATLYTLLTGKPPFDGSDMGAVLERAEKGDWLPPRVINREMPTALNAVCRKAMALRPEDRYPTALALATEVEHWLADEPVAAYRAPWRDRAWRWVGQHQTAVATTAAALGVALAALIVGVILLSAAAQRERLARDSAQQKEQAASAQRVEAEKQRDTARQTAYVASINLAQRAWEEANMERVRQLLAETAREEGGGSLRGFEWHYLNRLAHLELLTCHGHAGLVWSVAFSRDGRRLASASYDGTVKVWETAEGKEMFTLKGHAGPVNGVAFDPDGRRLASAGMDGTVKVWNTADGRQLWTGQGHSGPVWSVAFSPDGRHLASAGGDTTFTVWDAVVGKELMRLRRHSGLVHSVAFSRDGQRLASASDDRTVKVWEAVGGRELLTLRGHTDMVLSVAFSPDGRHLASASNDRTVRIWDTADGKELLTLQGHVGPVWSVAFSPDGQRLASASEDRTVRVWEVVGGRELFTLRGHSDMVWSVAFSPDGHRLASGSNDQTVKLWEVDDMRELSTLREYQGPVNGVAFSPDGQRLVTASGDRSVRVWDAVGDKMLIILEGHADAVNGVAFSPDGRRLASASKDGTVKVWETASGKVLLTCRAHAGPVNGVAFSPDGRRIASASNDRTVRVWDAADGKELLTLKGHGGVVWSVAFSPDSRRLASASGDGKVRIWGSADGEGLLTLEGHTGAINSVVFSPDGLRLASASNDRTVRIWEAASGKELLALKGHAGWVNSVAFSPEGGRLASASSDGTVKLWGMADGKELLTLKGHAGPVNSVAFSPDGWQLTSASNDRTVKVWKAKLPPGTAGASAESASVRKEACCVQQSTWGIKGQLLRGMAPIRLFRDVPYNTAASEARGIRHEVLAGNRNRGMVCGHYLGRRPPPGVAPLPGAERLGHR